MYLLGELMLRVPLFPGDSDTNQLAKIFNLLGTPTIEDWPGLASLPNYLMFEHRDALTVEEWSRLLPGQSSEAVTLLLHMLALNPCKRITAQESLSHDYFTSQPLPTETSMLRLPGGAGDEKSQLEKKRTFTRMHQN